MKKMITQKCNTEEKILIPGVLYVDDDGRELSRGVFYDIEKKKDELEDTSENSKNMETNPTKETTEELEEKPSIEVSDSVAAGAEIVTAGNAKSHIPENMNECMNFLADFFANLNTNSSQCTSMRAVIETNAEVEENSSNYELYLLKRIVEIRDAENGEIAKTFYKIRVVATTYDGEKKAFEAIVAGDQVREFKWITKATSSIVCPPSDKEEKKIFQEKVSACISTRGVPEEIHYSTVGWREIAPGCLRFITEEGAVGDARICANALGDKNALVIRNDYLGLKSTFDAAIQACGVCKSGVASTLLWVYLHASVLTTIFDRAGFPIHFIFGLVGVTNSKKTSLALALASIFGKGIPTADAEFATATACGIEKTLSARKDGIILIDDFKPGIDRQQQIALDKKLEALIRYYGNRVAKSRMTEFNANAEKLHFPILGCCLTTMEIITGVHSSMSRMLVTELTQNEVDNEKLGFFQNNSWILKTHIYDFLTWVTYHLDEIVPFVSLEMTTLRNQNNHRFAFARYAEIYATFVVTAKIIANYAIEKNFFELEEGNKFVAGVGEILELELLKMEERANCADKGRLILRALQESLSSRCLMPLPLTSDSMKLKEDAYEDASYLYIRPFILRKITNDYSGKFKLGQEIMNEAELNGLLERLGLILVKQGRKGLEKSHHLPKAKGNSCRYLFIKKSKFAELLEE